MSEMSGGLESADDHIRHLKESKEFSAVKSQRQADMPLHN